MTLTCEIWLSKKNLVVPEAANEVEQFTHCNKPSFARARLDSKKMSTHHLSMVKVALEFRPRTDFKPEHLHGY